MPATFFYTPRFQNFIVSRHRQCGFCLAVALLVVTCVSCTSRGNSTTPPPPPPVPQAADLRFQQVGAASTRTGYVALQFSNITSGLGKSFGDATGSPLEIGPGNCVPNVASDCNWFFGAFFLPTGASQLSTAYQPGILANIGTDLSKLSDSSTVITSLDVQVASSAYAVSSVKTSSAGGFDLAQHSVLPSGLQAAATQEGSLSRVITAVSFDSGQVDYLSYGWNSDTTTRYETRVAMATLDAIGSEAQNLAASGYIVTALGGNVTDGFVLIGTRVNGATTPRPLVVVNAAPATIPQDELLNKGYAIVGLVSNPNANVAIWVGEK
jgi:hypothetical protein